MSPSCRIPDIDPYHESIRQFVRKVNPILCAELPPLTRLSDDKLIYDDTIAPKYSEERKIACCYSHIERTPVTSLNNPDNTFT